MKHLISTNILYKHRKNTLSPELMLNDRHRNQTNAAKGIHVQIKSVGGILQTMKQRL